MVRPFPDRTGFVIIKLIIGVFNVDQYKPIQYACPIEPIPLKISTTKHHLSRLIEYELKVTDKLANINRAQGSSW